VIVRPFNNYGPRQHPEKVIPRFITQALADEPLTIHGDGHASRDWLYVDDDAEAIEAIIARRSSGRRRGVNVATGSTSPSRTIADSCSTCSASRRPEAHVDERLGQVDRHIGSTDKASGCSAGARARLRGRARAHRRVVPRE
jgi:dTDP-glucose 4,6-dehydratase